jgi:DNA polymerase eta
MLIASEIVRDVRRRIFESLQYTCSAGISRNKMLAKLGSGHKKPNSQTVIRNRAVQHFLSGFKFTKIRNLGGKLGDEVVAAFNTDAVSDLLPVSLEQLKKQLGDDTGSWLYITLRGEDHSEINPRTAIKSMLSAKSFRPSINTFEVACKWLRIFVADIFSRLVEEGVLENKRRPKTMNLHHRQGSQTRSKQVPIPLGKTITEDALFELAKNLLAQVIVDGRAWPCANLSLSVGGFEDGVTGNKGIGSFLVRGDEAKALQAASLSRNGSAEEKSSETPPPPNKRRKVGGGITSFFATRPGHDTYAGEDDGEEDAEQDTPTRDSDDGNDASHPQNVDPDYQDIHDEPPLHSAQPPTHQTTLETYFCPRCSKTIPLHDKTEHEDFHFAQDLQNQGSSPPPDRPPPKPVPPTKSTTSSTKTKGRGRPPGGLSDGGGVEKGQRRLAFG